MTPANERKAAERQRRKEAGLVRCEVWVKPEHVELVRGYAHGLNDVSSLMAKLARKPLTATKS